MKRLMIVAGAVALAGCMATTISKDYSADEVKCGEKLPFNKVENLDDIELLDKSAIPVVVKSESKKEQIHSPGGIHGLLWLCTLGIIPSWQTETETHTMSVATPLGERNGVCTVTKRQYLGWVPYMLPFSSSEEDVQFEEELLSRLVSQYKKEWTAENVSKMNAANSERIKALRAKADELLAQNKWSEVIKICKVAKNKAFVSEYVEKTKAARLTTIRHAVDSAMQKKDYKHVIDLLKAENDSELVAKRNVAIIDLIASSADGSQFDELMEGYGKTLTIQQLGEIGKKVSTDIIKSKLVEATDRKIVEQIARAFKQITVDFKDEVEKLSEERMKIHGNIKNLLEASSYGTTTVQQLVYGCIRKDVTGDKVLDYFYRGENTDTIDSYLTSWRINIDRDTARLIAERHESDAAREIAAKVKNEMIRYRAKEVEMQRAEEQNATRINHFIELLGMLQSEKLQADVVKKYDISNFGKVKELISVLVPRLSPAAIASLYEGKACSENRMTGFITEESDEGKVLFKSIPEDKLLRCLNIFSSKGHNTSYLVARIRNMADKKAIADEIVGLLNNKTMNERSVAEYVEKMGDGEATIALYNAAMGSALKQLIFSKLSAADKNTIRGSSAEKCKQMIEFAKSKSKETFEMHGFYLGMSMDDAELLVMYYFPELEAAEKRDDDGEYKLDISDQGAPFCWADKNRKVYQFNFGKKLLKKWYKYDASTIRDWAKAYSREHGIDLKLDFINRSDTVYLPNAMLQAEPYHVSLHQEIWTYKNGMKNYRLTYFGEREFGGERSVALEKYRHSSASEGTFRAVIEND